MNEKALAAALQASKDDGSEWGEPQEATESSNPPGKKLAAMISVRFSTDELEDIQHRAKERGQTVSAYIRALATTSQAPSSVSRNIAVIISSSGNYSAHVANPRLMSDGRRLETSRT